jgi:hypothetical protein
MYKKKKRKSGYIANGILCLGRHMLAMKIYDDGETIDMYAWYI